MEEVEIHGGGSFGQRRTKSAHVSPEDDGMELFRNSIEASDLPRVEVDRERLDLERERMEF